MKCVIYSRYSSDQQRATSIEDQARNCRKRAQGEGWEIVHEYADAAMSGADSARPQYQAMLAAAARREFDALLLDDLSRLTRDSVEQETVIRRLEFQGVRLVTTSDGYDSTSRARKMHRGFKGLMNKAFLDDHRDRVHRGLTGQALKHYWCGGRPYGFRLKPILDPTQRDAYGQPARIGTVLEVDAQQAAVVKEIFTRFVDGESCRAIAVELNSRGVASSGSTWRRTVRRCAGWTASSIREIVRNPLFTGRVRWNVSQFVRDPDTRKFKRRARPQSEWVVHQDEKLRIVSDALFEKAQARTRKTRHTDVRLKAGGKPKFLLSGLLRCSSCGASYTMADASFYSCGAEREGACTNTVRVRRDEIEGKILQPILKDLLSPARVARMAQELRAAYLERTKSAAERAVEAPRELQELDARLERLRERLRQGDPDMMADEIQVAIDRAQAKRAELEAAQPAAKQSARILPMLTKAAALYRKQIEAGLDGHAREALKARVILRELLGEIRLEPDANGSLWAVYGVQPAALVKRATGTGYRGDRI